MTLFYWQRGLAWVLFFTGLVFGSFENYPTAAYFVACACWWYVVSAEDRP